MTNGYAKLRLIMWKNWKMMLRTPLLTVVEILVPVFFSSLLLLLRVVGPMHHSTEVKHYTAYDPAEPPPEGDTGGGTKGIAWAPIKGSTQAFQMSCAGVMQQVFGQQGWKVIKKDDPPTLERYLQSPGVTDMAHGDKVLCGVVFDGQGDTGLCSEGLQVIIRFPGDLRTVHDFRPSHSWQTKRIIPTMITAAPRDAEDNTGAIPNYYKEGFLGVQVGLSKGVLGFCKNVKNPTLPPGFKTNHSIADLAGSLDPDLTLRRYSAVPYDDDPLLEQARFLVPFLVMLSFIYTCLSITKLVTHEKETQLKEVMKIMGLPSSLHWIAWFIRNMIILLIACALIVVILKVQWMKGNAVFNKTDGSLIYVFYIYYMVALCCFCFMISSFFTNAHLASVVSGLVWFLFYCPHFFMTSTTAVYSVATKIPLAVLLNVDMAFAFELFLISETTGKGVQWDNCCIPSNYSEKITVCHTMMMMLLDAVLYMLICLYVEAVLPGKYGVPQPWYYFFTKEHWLSRKEILRDQDIPKLPPKRSSVDPSNFEEEPVQLPVGVEIKNLWKLFGKKVSVHNLNLKMYEGQITVLLGHNGAGKTTTMSILTGIYTPTRGTAVVNGCDVVHNIEGARNSLGLCPQYNVLFDELTVREHLYFFCKLKGIPDAELKEEITRFVVMLELVPKEHAKSKTLSGGMKRKLNAGIALCAHSKVVLLDEPTSGMDPAARRAIWDVLLLEKEGRTMLLTTHFMDEADVLGDRICIMAAGELECSGSSFFLKNKFGTGYRLIIEKGPHCNSKNVTALLNTHLPGTQPSQEIGSELNYQLKKADVGKFEPMLKELEQQSDALGVESYGLSQTTMEEVFIRTGKDKEAEDTVKKIKIKKGGPKLVTGCTLECYRIEALFLKKSLVWVRNWIVFLLHCLFPVIFLLITLLVRFSDDADLDQTQMPMDLKQYETRAAITIASAAAANDDSNPNAGTRMMYYLYKQTVEGADGEVWDMGYQSEPHHTFDKNLLKKMKHDSIKVRTKYSVGASWASANPTKVIAWFCDLPFHAAPLAMSLVYNSALRAFNAHMRVISYPLEVSSNTKGIVKAAWSKSSRVAPMIAFAMSFVSAYYVQFIIRERECKNKHLQIVSGVEVWCFWLVHYTFDGLTFLLPCITTIVTLACFQEKGYDTPDALGRVFLILVVFGWGMLPVMYAASFLFNIPATGYTRMAMFNIFTGTASFLIIIVFKRMDVGKNTIDLLEWFVYFFPHYLLAHAVYYNYMNLINKELCKEFSKYCDVSSSNPCCPGKCPESGCLNHSDNYFQVGLPGVGTDLIVLVVEGILFFVILMLIDYNVFAAMKDACFKRKKDSDPNPPNEDSDVAAEKKLIRESDIVVLSKDYALVLKDVTKFYGNFLAVNHTCVAVQRGQCFGLLGTNGAGKTTTFKMMTGDIKMTGGEVYVDGLSAAKEKKKVQQRMGYCPQFDAVLEELTGWETMKIFSLLKGVPRKKIKKVSMEKANELLILKHMDKKSGTYSGGNKRKLSTAVALIGSPVVVFLDEPTTGMDPMARRHLWNIICGVRDSGTSVVLTSHSMEECEALCTRIAIQVNGNFRCLGSLQHLKQKFAKGFTLQIKVSFPKSDSPPTTRRQSITQLNLNLNPVKEFVQQNFIGAKLEDEYMGVVTYSIRGGNQTWSQLFGQMEKAKKTYAIEDYSIGQSSLETVFLTFTKEQEEDMNA